MLIIHQPLQVSIQEEFPELIDRGEGIPTNRVVDFVLTQALRAPVVIEAERLFSESHPTPWLLRNAGSWGPRTVIAQTPARLFRSILAWFNAQFLEGQLYGGCVRRVLSQGKMLRTVVIHTGNEGLSGFWIRIASGMPMGAEPAAGGAQG